jgi:heme-degrading monooxygenase HmoA
VIVLVLARMTVWHFKEGKGEKGFSELDIVLNTLAHQTEGFRGAISLAADDDPNSVTILTLWIDQEALDRSERDVFSQAVKRVQDSIDSAFSAFSMAVPLGLEDLLYFRSAT